MNRFTMESFDIKDFCRFNGTLATDRAGRLYDSAFRQSIVSTRRPLSEKEMRAVEALTALRITGRMARHLMDRWTDTHGLSEGRLHVLFQLKAAPERRLPLGELADRLEVTPRNVTGLIDRLERDGLVERIDDPDDRRMTYARLTHEGARKLDGLRDQGLQWQMRMASGLSIEELEDLRHACLKIIENMTRVPASEKRSA